MAQQQTIAREVHMQGRGLHTGCRAAMRLLPAAINTGIVFVRTDLPGKPSVQARTRNLGNRPRRTSLRTGDVEVQTIEHLMACFKGFAIDNVRIEIDAEEVPGGDGSAKPFADLIQAAGIAKQDAACMEYTIAEPIYVAEGDVSLIALPAAGGLTITYTLDYQDTSIGSQHFTYRVEAGTFAGEIAPARTFCLQSEAQGLLAQGYGKGANYDNTLVLGAEGPVGNALRFRDECVRHKVLDLMGDLALLPFRLNAHILAVKSGHASNAKLTRAICDAHHDKEEHMRSGTRVMHIEEVQDILPHRYPFLMVDRFLELVPNERAVGLKNVTVNEDFFQGHFPGKPVMPGVLQLEAMAQVGGAMYYISHENLNKLAYLITIDKAKLRHPVVPGDQLIMVATSLKLRKRVGSVFVESFVNGNRVAEAEMKFMFMAAERNT